MSREEMIEVVEKVMDKYTINEIKKAHQELKKIFGFAWVGARPTGTLEYKYTIIDDEKDACYIYADWWNGSVE